MKSKRIKPWNKITIGILAAFLIMSLTACGSANSTDNNSTSGTTIEKQELENEFKILSKKERREIYDKCNFNQTEYTQEVKTTGYYNCEAEKDEVLDKIVSFEVPDDFDIVTGTNDEGFVDTISYNTYISEETPDIQSGNIRVTTGKPDLKKTLESDEGYDEWVEVFNFKTGKVTGYIESNKAWTPSYYVFIQSDKINNNQPFLLFHIVTDNWELETGASEKSVELSNAITSQILESIDF